jgi:uncharacterized protein YqcC (DUF446 family)
VRQNKFNLALAFIMGHTKAEIYTLAEVKANEIEAELKSLNRWSKEPLPEEKFENMGAFGSNTMGFEQWLQFVLIPRIKDIVRTKDSFPDGSMLASYAIRVFDGDPEAGELHELLYQHDALINGQDEVISKKKRSQKPPVPVASNTVTLGDSTIPDVLYTLSGVLPQYEEAHELESQLQTFDTFLAMLSPIVRPQISDLLVKAAASTTNPLNRQRIEKAARDVACGKLAAEPYNHEVAMKKYMEEHRKRFS